MTQKSPKESMLMNYATSHMTMKKSFKIFYIATDLNTSGT